MMTEPTAFQEIVEAFSHLEGWEARYGYILDLGRALPKLTEYERTEANRIHGCVSQVWLVPKVEQRNRRLEITYRGESDAMIVQGLIAILVALYSGRSAVEITETDGLALLDNLGLRAHLTAQRSNGLVAMVNRIRAAAREHLSTFRI